MTITVAQALKIGGLGQGKVLAGSQHLGNIIENVNILEAPWEPDWDTKNQLFLTSFYAIKDDVSKQVYTVKSLGELGSAGLVFQTGILDRLEPQVIEQAEKSGLPLIQVTDAADYPSIIGPLVGAILREKTFLLQRAQEIHHRFTDLILSGGGLPAIATALHDLIKRPVAIVNTWGEVLAATHFEDIERIAASLAGKILNADGKAQTETIWLTDDHVWVSPFSSEGQSFTQGFVVVSDPTGNINPIDLTAIEQAATVTILEVIKQKAVLETEKRLKRDFLEDMLAGEYRSTEAILARARSVGWDLSHKRVVLLVDLNRFEQYYLTHIERGESFFQQIKEQFLRVVSQVVLAHNLQNILVDRSDSIIVLPHFEKETPMSLARRTTRTLAQNIHSETKAALTGLTISVAVGGFYDSVERLSHSFREAKAALAVSRQLAKSNSVIWYDDVALYVFLNRFARQPEVHRWFEQTLGKLVTYDQNNDSELVKTLEIYFDTNQVSRQTAHNLFIHPKTLKYRLRRIEEILGANPFDGDKQLSFYLATKLVKFL